jgi:hypothetical protein
MNSVKIALVALAIFFGAFASIVGYQYLVVGPEHHTGTAIPFSWMA